MCVYRCVSQCVCYVLRGGRGRGDKREREGRGEARRVGREIGVTLLLESGCMSIVLIFGAAAAATITVTAASIAVAAAAGA